MAFPLANGSHGSAAIGVPLKTQTPPLHPYWKRLPNGEVGAAANGSAVGGGRTLC